MEKNCCIPSCMSHTWGDKKYPVFPFPKDFYKRDIWIKEIHKKIKDPGSYQGVCIIHFEEKFIQRSRMEIVERCFKLVSLVEPCLTENAYPSLFLTPLRKVEFVNGLPTVGGRQLAKSAISQAVSIPVNVCTAPVSLPSLIPFNAPVTTNIVPVNANTVPFNAITVPFNVNTVPVNGITLPVNANTVPVNAITVPVNANTVPVNAIMIPVNAVKVPVNSNTVPVNANTVPVNAVMVPVNANTVPATTITIPDDDDVTIPNPAEIATVNTITAQTTVNTQKKQLQKDWDVHGVLGSLNSQSILKKHYNTNQSTQVPTRKINILSRNVKRQTEKITINDSPSVATYVSKNSQAPIISIEDDDTDESPQVTNDTVEIPDRDESLSVPTKKTKISIYPQDPIISVEVHNMNKSLDPTLTVEILDSDRFLSVPAEKAKVHEISDSPSVATCVNKHSQAPINSMEVNETDESPHIPSPSLFDSLYLDCWEDELSSAQLDACQKAKDECDKMQSELNKILEQSGCGYVYSENQLQQKTVPTENTNQTISAEKTTSTLLPRGRKKRKKIKRSTNLSVKKSSENSQQLRIVNKSKLMDSPNRCTPRTPRRRSPIRLRSRRKRKIPSRYHTMNSLHNKHYSKKHVTPERSNSDTTPESEPESVLPNYPESPIRNNSPQELNSRNVSIYDEFITSDRLHPRVYIDRDSILPPESESILPNYPESPNIKSGAVQTSSGFVVSNTGLPKPPHKRPLILLKNGKKCLLKKPLVPLNIKIAGNLPRAKDVSSSSENVTNNLNSESQTSTKQAAQQNLPPETVVSNNRDQQLEKGEAAFTVSPVKETKEVIDLVDEDEAIEPEIKEEQQEIQKKYPTLAGHAVPCSLVSKENYAADASALNAELMSVYALSPAQLVEWLIQKRVLCVERFCVKHPTNKLKLAKFSAASRFPKSGGYFWLSDCCPKTHVSVFSDSFFESEKTPQVLLRLIFHWICQTSVQSVAALANVDYALIAEFYTLMRAICTASLQRNMQLMGGDKKKVEISLISLCTKAGGLLHPKIKVLGILDREQKKMYLTAIENSKSISATEYLKCFKILTRWVHRESIILTDITIAKSTLNIMGYKYIYQVSTDNNSPDNTNRNILAYLTTVVSEMFKNNLTSLSKEEVQQFLDELIWRENHGGSPSEAFKHMMNDIAEQTNTGSQLIDKLKDISLNPFKGWLSPMKVISLLKEKGVLPESSYSPHTGIFGNR